MYAQLLGLLLIACQIIFNESSPVPEDGNSGGTPSGPSSLTLPEGYIVHPDIHTAYKLHEEETTWDEARERCVAEGACLAIIDTVQKIRYINSQKTHRSFGKWIHVGIHQANGTDPWVRVDNGLPVASVPWLRRYPLHNGNCAGISIAYDGLVDYQCFKTGEHYACEIAT